MNPEDLIFAFLQIWENNPDNIIETSGAINNLQQLSDDLLASQDKSDLDILQVIQRWCRQYPQLRDKFMTELGEKTVKPSANIPKEPEKLSIINQYPHISEILRNRPPKTTKQNK